jgi:REP-associated tyrosine transposase
MHARVVVSYWLKMGSWPLCVIVDLSEIGLRTPGVNPGVKARSRRLQVFIRRFCYHVGMKIKLSAHGAYHHQYHVVWIPKYRKKILKGQLKQYLEKGLFDITTFHPDIEIETWSIQVDHIHLVIVIPPKYAVSDIVGKIKANTSREIRKRFPWIKKIYWRNELWSVGFFSSTVGVNEDVIKRYVEFQEKVDTGKAQLDFGF